MFLAITTPTVLEAARLSSGSKYCPSVNPKITWRDYLAGRYIRVGSVIMGPKAGVDLRLAKTLPGPAAIGKLKPHACYFIVSVIKPNPSHKKKGIYSTDSTLGRANATFGNSDIDNHHVAVKGVELVFDDLGNVYDQRGRVAGQLSCILRTPKHCN